HSTVSVLIRMPTRWLSPLFPYATLFRSDGAILWEKRLLGIGLVAHSEYWNMLQIAVVDDAVVVYGNEASGRYVEVVDPKSGDTRSEEHTSELQSRENLVCRLLLEKKDNM